VKKKFPKRRNQNQVLLYLRKSPERKIKASQSLTMTEKQRRKRRNNQSLNLHLIQNKIQGRNQRKTEKEKNLVNQMIIEDGQRKKTRIERRK